MVKTRSWVHQLTGSRRVISHGLMSPDLGTRNLESMQVQSEKLKIEAWKGYTGQSLTPGKVGWWLDDKKEAYPTLEYSRKLKIRNICIHKGLALAAFDEEHCNPRDVVKASKDFPDLNFLLYHSGFKSLQDALPAAESGFQKTSDVPWVSDLCEWRKKNPHMQRVHGTGQYLRNDGNYLSAALRSCIRHDHRRLWSRPCALGHRLNLVGISSMAN